MTEPHSTSAPSREELHELNSRILVCRDSSPLSELRCFPIEPVSKGWGACLREAGNELVLGAIESGWLFLWIVDVLESRLRCRVSVPLAGATLSRFRAAIDRDLFRLITDEEVIEISMAEWRIIGWRTFRGLASQGALIETVSILPGSRYMWLECSRPPDVFIIDLSTWSVSRILSGDYGFLGSVSGSPEPLYVFHDSDSKRIYRTDGSTIPELSLPSEQEIWSIAAAPGGGEDFVGMRLASLDHDGLESYDELQWIHIDPRAAEIVSIMSRGAGADLVEEGVHKVTISREAETLFTLLELPGRRHRSRYVYGVALTKRGFRTRYRVRVPYHTVLVQEPRGRRVVALFPSGNGLGLRILDKSRPVEFERLAEHVYEYRYLSPTETDIEEDTEPMTDPPEPAKWSPERCLLRQFLGAIRMTNRAFAAGDPAAAKILLDRPVFWQMPEIETAARRAAAFLAASEADEAAQFSKRFALARFLGTLGRRFPRQVRLPGVTWEEAEIRRVEKRARAWLETS